MLKLDQNFLRSVGLAELPTNERQAMLAHIYDTLELRTGMVLAEQMSDAQLDEFEAFIDANDEDGALHWLEDNFPDYRSIVAKQLSKLRKEIRSVSSKILAECGTTRADETAPSRQGTGIPAFGGAARDLTHGE